MIESCTRFTLLFELIEVSQITLKRLDAYGEETYPWKPPT